MNEVIKTLEKKKKDYLDWYMNRDRVSLIQMIEKDDFVKKCDWAIKQLKEIK